VTVAPAFAAGGDLATSGRGESQLRARLRALRGDATRIESADEVLGLLDGGRLGRADGLADLVDRASERSVRAGVDRVVQMPPPLCDMLPGRGLRRGSTVAVRGSTSMLFVMLAAATRAGCWCAVVGMPNLGLVAADELNVDLERQPWSPTPVRIGPNWSQRCSTASISWWWRRQRRQCRRVVCRHAPGNAGPCWWASVNGRGPS